VSTLGSAFSTSANGSVLWCYAHDSDSGIDLAAGCKAIGCVADTCITYGVRQTGNNSGILNSTIYNCGSGVSLSTYVGAIVVGNIVKGCTVGLVCASTRIDGNYVDYNCLDNTTNRSYVPAGAHDVEADPLLNDPANGDFSLAVGSPCFDAGAQLDSTVGLP
jgi:hypothetical protein